MINLKPALLVGRLQGVLEIVCYALFAELFLHTINDAHDPLDVSVENITDLQALESDLAIVCLIS